MRIPEHWALASRFLPIAMKILSHRGYWKTDAEKNSDTSFRRSFELGFGTETDFRDFAKTLVVSHDVADETAMTAHDFFAIYKQHDFNLPLAINIKSDGLQRLLRECLSEYEIQNYFIFDMSVPDAIAYIRQGGFNVFTRQSEYEKEPSFYEHAQGVWMDMFLSDWIEEEDIAYHLKNKKKVCVVSPELHKREHLGFWEKLSKMPFLEDENLMICTDFPEDAKNLFGI